MRKLLLPISVMVSAYIAVHLFVIGNLKNSDKTKSSTIFTSNIHPALNIFEKKKKPFVVKKAKGSSFNKKNINSSKVKKDQLLDLTKISTKNKVNFVSYIKKADGVIEIKYERTGTKIEIPANAFVSKSGDVIVGDIEIRYREFISPSEIFTSGIPMHLQGDNYLESAGMFEIEAWQNGEKIELAPNTQMEITMTSTFTDKDYNLYAFNNTDQNWDYVNNNFSYNDVADNTTTNNQLKDWREISNEDLPQYVSEKVEYYVPVKDVVGFTPDYDDALHKKENTIYRQTSVKLIYDPQLFPDLAALGLYEYRILSHKYGELEKIANSVMTKDTQQPTGWKDLKIQYPGQLGMIDLKFINDLDTFVLGAEPILTSLGYKKKFLNQYYDYAAYYEQARLGRLSIKKFKMGMKKVDFDKDTALVKQLRTQKLAEKVERKFLADKMIVWNCDRPFPIRPYEAVAVNFTSDRVTNISKIYAAIPGKNSVLQATDFIHFPLVNNGEMYVWVLVDENTVAYATPEMMKEIKWDKKEVNDIPLKTMSLDAFLIVLDKDILSSKEKLKEFV